MLEALNAWVWGPWTLAFFLLVGLYYSLGTGFFQLFGVRRWMGATLGALRRGRQRPGELTPLETMSAALAATVGTGSIAGVATAITMGGPGAVLWMWAAALVGMMTGYAEKALAILVRRRGPDGGWRGGPMIWLEELGMRRGAVFFAVCCGAASLGMGNLVQSNSIAQGLETAFSVPPLLTGAVTAALAGAALVGGVGRIGRVCGGLVPVMALFFLIGGGAALARQWDRVPEALALIWTQAWDPAAAAGGGAGAAVRYGVARGVSTNEAGLGSTPMVHAASGRTDPAEEGMWGIFEVFVSTFLVCTVTALVILTSGLWQGGLSGAALSAAAFGACLGRGGEAFVAVCLALFAFSTLLGWSWYGMCAVEYLLPGRGRRGYLALFLLCILAGSVGRLETLWQLSDLCCGLMALPSLTALVLLSPRVFAAQRAGLDRAGHG